MTDIVFPAEAAWTSVCEQVADVVERHQPHPDSVHACCCGWGEDEFTHGEHVAQVLANLGLLAVVDRSGVAGEPEATPKGSEIAVATSPTPTHVDTVSGPVAADLAGGAVVSDRTWDGAALLRRAAAGRLEYAANAPADQREVLEAEANVLQLAARVVAGDLGPLLGWMPSWRWTDEMTRWALRREPDDPRLCAICGDDIWPGEQAYPADLDPESSGVVCAVCEAKRGDEADRG